jgi:hypothetical protein
MSGVSIPSNRILRSSISAVSSDERFEALGRQPILQPTIAHHRRRGGTGAKTFHFDNAD